MESLNWRNWKNCIYPTADLCLCRLHHMKFIYFVGCHHLVESIPLHLKLPHVEMVSIAFSVYEQSLLIFTWIMECPPNVYHICLHSKEDTQVDIFLEFLRTANNMHFREKLYQIELTEFNMNEKQLETFLFDALPKYPEVAVIDFNHNCIQSFEPIVEII